MTVLVGLRFSSLAQVLSLEEVQRRQVYATDEYPQSPSSSSTYLERSPTLADCLQLGIKPSSLHHTKQHTHKLTSDIHLISKYFIPVFLQTPTLTIDIFSHMYKVGDFRTCINSGKLDHFLCYVHCRKLHRDFHHGPNSSDAAQDSKFKTLLAVHLRASSGN